MPPLLEVIACSVADAVEAEKGGANRLEIVRDLGRGGLTPPFELVAKIKQAVKLPLRVMLRESDSYETSSTSEIDRLCVAAVQFASLVVDGFVLGFLKDGEVDVERTQRVLACAPQVRATFHHAFEAARDKLNALDVIKSLPQIDRILSSGGPGDLELRVARLGQYAKAAAPELTILAGGGVDGDALLQIARDTNIREFHVGRAARAQFQVEGYVQASLVSELVKKLRDV
ncbi:MAG TPA: copper homeostasis protein CutC [Pyrinomonadaceae bacterium]|nr:copper homeostasis protein CutC [Pyrinomonadaceae bacterium]